MVALSMAVSIWAIRRSRSVTRLRRGSLRQARRRHSVRTKNMIRRLAGDQQVVCDDPAVALTPKQKDMLDTVIDAGSAADWFLKLLVPRYAVQFTFSHANSC